MPDQPILVTGGAGFIGSHLVDALLARGEQVRVLDNLSAGSLDNLATHPRLTVIEGDVGDLATVTGAVAGCRAVVHLAAVASVQASVEDPLGTHRTNLVGTLNLCEAMRQEGVRRILFASSAAVYGNQGEGRAIGETTTTAPLTPYAVDKLASEQYLDFYRRQHGLEPVIWRFFNIYGPRQNPASPYSGVISILTERACSGAPITIYGDGEQTRDFFYIDDLVALLLQGLDAAQPVLGPVNVGHGRSTSLNELLALIEGWLGRPLQVDYSAPRSGDIRHSLADNSRLRACYALAEPVGMREGLERLLRERKGA
ncbi:NAD-dependent epimerase/dehydratase family protein [Stutzerimonas urumqiensis]|uniref:NAD-dependent epimerase/dehydratase family protein n=1 Tax=Stutzerimonas urumqiensis TaxID=638269 RepID=UPI000EAFC6AA|nr:NAD-dependent epimerase/dehydratase family protein [Stutzerimonas urumqiensis]